MQVFYYRRRGGCVFGAVCLSAGLCKKTTGCQGTCLRAVAWTRGESLNWREFHILYDKRIYIFGSSELNYNYWKRKAMKSYLLLNTSAHVNLIGMVQTLPHRAGHLIREEEDGEGKLQLLRPLQGVDAENPAASQTRQTAESPEATLYSLVEPSRKHLPQTIKQGSFWYSSTGAVFAHL